MTRISASVLFTPYSKLYILTKLSTNDVKFISNDRQTFQNIHSYGTVNSIFVEIQPDSTNIKNDPRTYRITHISAADSLKVVNIVPTYCYDKVLYLKSNSRQLSHLHIHENKYKH